MSLLELMFTVAIMAVVVASIHAQVHSMRQLYTYGETEMTLQEVGRRAMEEIAQDLTMAGRLRNELYPDRQEYEYPHAFPAGDPEHWGADSPYIAHHKRVPDQRPQPYVDPAADPEAAGPSQEIIFRRPEDLDGDGRPINSTVDADGDGYPDGDIEWGPDEFTYVIVPSPEGGCNELQRRIVDPGTGDTRLDKVKCRYVERFVVSTYTTDTANLAYDQVRVRLYLRKRTEDGSWIKADFGRIITMRNIE